MSDKKIATILPESEKIQEELIFFLEIERINQKVDTPEKALKNIRLQKTSSLKFSIHRSEEIFPIGLA